MKFNAFLTSAIVVLYTIPTTAQDKVEFKDEEDNILISINDEGSAGSLVLEELITSPSDSANKLYNLGGILYYNGFPLRDNMGDHIAVQNLQVNGFWLSHDGDNEGLMLDSSGWVGVNNASPLASLHVEGTGQYEAGVEPAQSNVLMGGGTNSGNNWNISANECSRTITTPSQNGNYSITKPLDQGDTIVFTKTSSTNVPDGYVRIKPSGESTWTSFGLEEGSSEYICQTGENYDFEFQYNSTCSGILGNCIFPQQITVAVTKRHLAAVYADEPIALFSGGGNVGIGTTTPSEKLSVEGVVESRFGGIKFPDGSLQATSAISDNLGDHSAQQNLELGGHWISNDGEGEGLLINEDGWAGVNEPFPLASLHVLGTGQYGIDPVATTQNLNITGGSSSGTVPWNVNNNTASVSITEENQTGLYNFQYNLGEGDDIEFNVILSLPSPSGLIRIKPQGGSWTTFNFSTTTSYSYTCPQTGNYIVEFIYNADCFGMDGLCLQEQSASVAVERTTYTYTMVDEPVALFSGGGNVGIGTTTPQQKLSVDGTIESMSGGIKFPDGSVQTSAVQAVTDTDDQTLSLSNNILQISEGNQVDLSLFLDDTDNQTLSLNATQLSIYDGNSVDLGPILPDDDQTLSFDGSLLSISGGNNVNLGGLKDNFGNHTATQTINTNNHWISGDGGGEGLYVADNGNVGVGTSSPGAKLTVNGTAKIGTNGTNLTSIIKVTKNVNFPNVPSNDVVFYNITGVTNAVTGSTVFISPSGDFPGSLYIGNCHVSSNGTVRVQLLNEGNNGQNVAAMDYYITIIK